MVRLPGPDGNSKMHASLRIGNSVVMLVDEFPDMGCLSPDTIKGTPVAIHLYVEDVDTVFRKAVEAGAKETVPLENTFWGTDMESLRTLPDIAGPLQLTLRTLPRIRL